MRAEIAAFPSLRAFSPISALSPCLPMSGPRHTATPVSVANSPDPSQEKGNESWGLLKKLVMPTWIFEACRLYIAKPITAEESKDHCYSMVLTPYKISCSDEEFTKYRGLLLGSILVSASEPLKIEALDSEALRRTCHFIALIDNRKAS